MTYKAQLELDGWPAAKPSDLIQVQRKTWAFLGKFWHKHYKAIKFTQSGQRLYHYTPREGDPGSGKQYRGSYREAKVLKLPYYSVEGGDGFNETGPLPIGEVKPNVWSGLSRTSAMAANQVKATAKSSGYGRVSIIMHAPTLHRSKKNARIRMHEEVTRILDSELETMNKVGVVQFDQNLLRLRRSKTIKIT